MSVRPCRTLWISDAMLCFTCIRVYPKGTKSPQISMECVWFHGNSINKIICMLYTYGVVWSMLRVHVYTYNNTFVEPLWRSEPGHLCGTRNIYYVNRGFIDISYTGICVVMIIFIWLIYCFHISVTLINRPCFTWLYNILTVSPKILLRISSDNSLMLPIGHLARLIPSH